MKPDNRVRLTGWLDWSARRAAGTTTASREAAIWAYRLLLGREPESESAIAAAAAVASREELVHAVLTSAEFESRGLAPAHRMRPDAAALEVEWEVDGATIRELLTRVAETWERLGEQRPHWSVLTGPQFLPERIQTQEDAFFQSGAIDLRILLATLARVGREPAQFDVLVEFGCGVGRVTGHLARAFKTVISCDISSRHLALAQQALAERGIANVSLRQATVADFGMAGPFDLWFSRLVLQHNSPPVIAAILDRALALLRTHGLAVFQVPVYCSGYRFKVEDDKQARAEIYPFEMHILPQSAIFAIAARNGCKLLEVREDDSAGGPWISQFFAVQKL